MSCRKGYFHSLSLDAYGHMLEHSFELKVFSAENCQQTEKYPKTNSFLSLCQSIFSQLKCHYVTLRDDTSYDKSGTDSSKSFYI